MFYEKLFFTVSLSLVNYLTVEKGFKIVKVKRDMKSSYIIYFYFEQTPELLDAVEEFNEKKLYTPNDVITERLANIENGVWRGTK